MKRSLFLALIILAYLSLMGCAAKRYPYIHTDFTHEGWMGYVDSDPNRWTHGSDNWFLTGDPNATELMDRNAPISAAISTEMVRVSDFTNIKSNGDFQVQLFGAYGPNSVYVYGPNDGVRATMVEVHGNTLCITQAKNARRGLMRKVIIRIGINQLHNLIQLGCGPIEGIQLRSTFLSITAAGQGNIYLAGPMNVNRVVSTSSGSVSLFGANTPWLDIKTMASGSVNVSGNVGVHVITHHGIGNINIIGANSNDLRIYADGRGKVGVKGTVNIREIKARDRTCVYVCHSSSPSTYIWAYDAAKVGVAGNSDNLYVDTSKGARFAGRYLCSSNAFVRAHNWSHINIAARNKVFAAATDNSSVYLYGSPNIMSQFISGYGVVIPIWDSGSSCPVTTLPVPYSYKGENLSTPAPKAEYKWVNKKLVMRGQG